MNHLKLGDDIQIPHQNNVICLVQVLVIGKRMRKLMLLGIVDYLGPENHVEYFIQNKHLRQFWTGIYIVKKGFWAVTDNAPLITDIVTKHWLTSDNYYEYDWPLRKATTEEQKHLTQLQPYPRVAAEKLCVKIFEENCS